MELLQLFSGNLGSVGIEVLGPRGGYSKNTPNLKLWLPSCPFGILKVADYQPKKGVTTVAEVLTPDYHEVVEFIIHNEGKDVSNKETIHLGVSWYFHAQL